MKERRKAVVTIIKFYDSLFYSGWLCSLFQEEKLKDWLLVVIYKLRKGDLANC